MTILADDVKLVASKVMDDVPEGGGGPTSTVIADGVSNAIFPDVSDLDRAVGNVSLRQVFVSVQTDDTDTYLGSNIIVAEPPDDPNVSVTLFSTGEVFDHRVDAKARIEAFLAPGVSYAGYLFGNHIAGQSAVLIYQRSTDVPSIGQTILLRKREGYSDEAEQFIRVTEASVEERTFEDDKGEFVRNVVTLQISDPLRMDFLGFDVARENPTSANIALRTRILDTVVANAARYYGVTELTEEINLGDFTFRGDSIYSQLVPSAQTEVPIADARTNQLSAGLVAAGSIVSLSLTSTFTTSASLFIGGAVLPGSLILSRGGVDISDNGGVLYSASVQVGTIDYQNGILSLSTNVFGTGPGTHGVVYTPAVVPAAVNMSVGKPITIENRSLSYVFTIEPVPTRASLKIDYMVAGRWYVLREDGTGGIRGSDSSFGAGTLNYTTGTVSVTLGALPDVGSSLIIQWVEPSSAKDNALISLDNNGKFYFPINTNGDASTAAGPTSIQPGAMTITWNNGGTKTVTDDGEGLLTGDGTGTVDYPSGVVRLSPNALPPPGTTINMSVDTAAKISVTPSTVIAGSVLAFTFGYTNITPGSVLLYIVGQLKFKYLGGPSMNWGGPRTFALYDDLGDGKLYLSNNVSRLQVGTVNYVSGTATIDVDVAINSGLASLFATFDNIYRLEPAPNYVGFALRGA